MIISGSKTDFDTSIRKALAEIDPNYENLYGIVITGSHAPLDVELKIELIRMARERKIPLLGICMGFQLMCIEYLRTFIPSANSEEIDKKTPNPVITKMSELRVGMLPAEEGLESFWHNYKFNKAYENTLSMEYKLFYAGDILTKISHEENPFCVGVQYHPEYQSSVDKPHPILVEFIKACKGNTKKVVEEYIPNPDNDI